MAYKDLEKRKAYLERWKEANKKERNEYFKQYREANKNKIKEANHRWHEANKQKQSEYNQRYYKNNKEKIREAHYLTNYNITVEERNKMSEEQKGICPLCLKHESELNKILIVDHNHTTGKVRKLLCDSCNRGIGLLRENVDILKRAIEYLEEHK